MLSPDVLSPPVGQDTSRRSPSALHERNPNSFAMPREQFLSWRFVTARSSLSPQGGSRDGARELSFFWARNALFHALRVLAIRTLGASPDTRLCLQGSGGTLSKPTVCTSTSTNIRRDCTPGPLTKFESQNPPDTSAVLAVHYFGFPQPIQEFRNLCDTRNLACSKDCADTCCDFWCHSQGESLDLRAPASQLTVSSCRMLMARSYCFLIPSTNCRQIVVWNILALFLQAARHIAGKLWSRSDCGRGKTTVSAGSALAKRVRSGPQSPLSHRQNIPFAVDNNSAVLIRLL